MLQPKNEIKYGFLISKGRIYDTKIQSYRLVARKVDGLVVYRMVPHSYTRLDFMEHLFKTKTNSEIFKILKNNDRIKKMRKNQTAISNKTLLNISNMAVIYMYPPKYLTQKKFYLYKSCQSLKKRHKIWQIKSLANHQEYETAR